MDLAYIRELARSAGLDISKDKDPLIVDLCSLAEQFHQEQHPPQGEGREGNPADGAQSPLMQSDPFEASWGQEFRLSSRGGQSFYHQGTCRDSYMRIDCLQIGARKF